MTLEKLHSYIMKNAMHNKAGIYGEDAKMFLQFIQQVDAKLAHSEVDGLPNYVRHGVFSTLRDFTSWASWLFHYCHLIGCLEQLHPNASTAGRNSRITEFRDYAVYREVTKRNACGYLLDEAFAESEYTTARNKASMLTADKYVNCWLKFETFIIHTMSIACINVHVVGAFCSYIDYICASRRDLQLELYLAMLLHVKLQPYAYAVRIIITSLLLYYYL
jgi:hypothetical protein